MTSRQTRASDWEVLDTRAVDELRSRGTVTDTLDISSDAALVRAEQLSKLAVAGSLPALETAVDEHRKWASQCGLRRIENALIELERVIAGPKRGQAVFQAQALTRFIRRHVLDDIAALEKALQQP